MDQTAARLLEALDTLMAALDNVVIGRDTPPVAYAALSQAQAYANIVRHAARQRLSN